MRALNLEQYARETGGIHYDSRAAWLADGKVKL